MRLDQIKNYINDLFYSSEKRDDFYDRIPIVSTFTNIFNIIHKKSCENKKELNEADNKKTVNEYKYLDKKSLSRCVCLSVPVLGNIGVPIYDFFKKRQLLDAIKTNPASFKTADLIWRSDKELALAALKHDPSLLLDAGKDLVEDRNFLLEAAGRNGLILQYLKKIRPLDATVDKEIVLAAVRQNGLSLEHAGEFKNDFDVVMAAVSQNGLALEHAGEDIKRSEPSILFSAVRNNGMALEYVPIEERSFDIIEAAVSQNGMAVQFAGDFANSPEIQSKIVRGRI